MLPCYICLKPAVWFRLGLDLRSKKYVRPGLVKKKEVQPHARKALATVSGPCCGFTVGKALIQVGSRRIIGT